MTALQPLRDALRACLGPRVLLRRDQTMRALFLCDAPRRLPDAANRRARLEAAGFAVTEENGLWRVDLSPARQIAFLAACAPGSLPRDIALRSLCRSLLAPGDTPPERQPWPPVRQTLLCLDAGDTPRLLRELRAAAAVCKRRHTPLPTAAAYLIEAACTEEGGLSC